MNAHDLQEQVRRMGPWFHNLHLPGGVLTAPESFLGDFPAYKWATLAPHLPWDLTGTSVLDIGCNAGFYSIEMARRGADVTALDANPHYLEQARWAVGLFGLTSRVEFLNLQVHELGRGKRQWDMVLFMGVLYHLRYPLLALDIMRRITVRTLIFQTLTLPFPDAGGQPLEQDVEFERRGRLGDADWPRMAFVEHRLAGDPTNWWVADTTCAEAMLRSSGFAVTGRVDRETWLCRPDGGAEIPAWTREEFAAALGLSCVERQK